MSYRSLFDICLISSLNRMLPDDIKLDKIDTVKCFDQYQELYREFTNFYKITDKISVDEHNI